MYFVEVTSVIVVFYFIYSGLICTFYRLIIADTASCLSHVPVLLKSVLVMDNMLILF